MHCNFFVFFARFVLKVSFTINEIIGRDITFYTVCMQMGMKEDNDEVITRSRILSLELLQVNNLRGFSLGSYKNIGCLMTATII